ncbi:Translation elongation factor [Penicillium subrubescens]|uniref:NmrA-like domain-containing protein n=1 Tax=Penicillium subrubescens TaxID=1316194 RepID=A0A1Q5TP67_9EURO|nr:Translation elongation factor [Penicillium subrubescens]KAJ5880497.1 Translation elongation factor [Penicillium subrubescens]OKP02006.1 hypothetical protein PENSUB_7236 [Penicillium subrubescens]
MPTVVGIAGFTGKFAQCVAQELQAYTDVTIRGYCRSPDKLPQSVLKEYGIEVIKGDYDDKNSIQKFVRGTDIVICCYFGSPDVMTRGQMLLVDACEEAGVPRYVPSDFAVDFTKIPTGTLFPKESTKIIMEYLSSKKVDGVHILVGGLMETFWSEFFQIWDPETQSMAVWGSGNDAWDLTSYKTAAAYTAAVTMDPSAVGVFRFLGDHKSASEIKEIFENVYHSELRLDRLGSIDDLFNTVQAEFAKNRDDISKWAPQCFAYWCTSGKAYLGDDLDNHKYPHVQPVNLEAFLHSHKLKDLHEADRKLGF